MLDQDEKIYVGRITVLVMLAWTLFVALVIGYQQWQHEDEIIKSALIQARIAFAKDVLYRRWNAEHGGVYVEVTPQTPPNPFLHGPERDITTASGKHLTMINPAYMTRMVYGLEDKDSGTRGHITSLQPINPANAPAPWEAQALATFTKADDVYYASIKIDGRRYLRYMKPFIVRKPCLKCHADQGYKVGDVRGGISITVPLSAIEAIQHATIHRDYGLFFLLWFVGMLGLGLGWWYLDRQVTRQKKMATDLIKVKFYLDQIHDGVFVVAPDTLRFIYVNQGAAEQVGLAVTELLDMTILDIMPDSDEQSFRQLLRAAQAAHNGSDSIETGFWHSDGFLLPVELTVQFLGQAGAGHFIVLAHDLTKSNREKEEYRRIFDASHDAIVILNEEGFLDCNKAALRMFGYKNKDDFLVLQPADVSPERQPDGSLSTAVAQQHIQTAITLGVDLFEWRHRRQDGTEFPAEVLLSSFERGGATVLQGVVRDLSERQRVEKEKEKLQSELLHAQKLESVGQLAAGIAHEINTPTQYVGSNIDFLADALADIKGCMARFQEIAAAAPESVAEEIKAALDEADWDFLAEELPQALSQSQEGVKRVTSIVRAMKEFSHPGSKEMTPTDINSLLETTITVARNEWKYVADMEMDLAEDLPSVHCLANEMGQVILNLLVNGAHAIGDVLEANPDIGTGLLRVKTRYDEDNIYIEIGDSGAGIPADIQARVFDPFFTTKTVGKGTGQGLAIAHDVITEKHGGSLTFTSHVGEGTTFIITLPRHKEVNNGG